MERIKVYPSVRPGMKMVFDGDLLEVTEATYEAENGVVKLHVTLDNNVMTEVEHFSNCPVGEPIEVYRISKSRIHFRTENIYGVVEDFEDGDSLASKLLWYGDIALGRILQVPVVKKVKWRTDVLDPDRHAKLEYGYCLSLVTQDCSPVIGYRDEKGVESLYTNAVELEEEFTTVIEVLTLPAGVFEIISILDEEDQTVKLRVLSREGSAIKIVKLNKEKELESF